MRNLLTLRVFIYMIGSRSFLESFTEWKLCQSNKIDVFELATGTHFLFLDVSLNLFLCENTEFFIFVSTEIWILFSIKYFFTRVFSSVLSGGKFFKSRCGLFLFLFHFLFNLLCALQIFLGLLLDFSFSVLKTYLFQLPWLRWRIYYMLLRLKFFLVYYLVCRNTHLHSWRKDW